MRIVLDTNIFIAAFISKGHCADVYEYISQHHIIFISPQILQELETNLLKKFHYPRTEVDQVMRLVKQYSRLISTVPKLKRTVSRDKADDGILALAVVAGADVLISGDRDLFDLKTFQNIPIIRPADFWKFEASY